MKKYYKLILAVAVVVASLVFFTVVEAPHSKIFSSRYEYAQYYAPVTDYFNEKSNITIAEIQAEITKGKVVITEDSREDLRTVFGDLIDQAQVVGKEQIKTKIKEGNLGLLRWDEIEADLKTLTLDNLYLWNKNELVDYQLKIIKKTNDKSETEAAFNPDKITKLLSTGDVIMSRTVAVKMREKGVLAPWQNVKEKLAAADLTFISLEAPFSDRFPAPTAGMQFIVPTNAITGLLESGVDVAGVANNHSTNFGLQVFADNLNLLKTNNILFTGGGNNLTEAETPAIIEKNGLKWGFLDWNSITGAISATENSAGVAPLRIKPWSAEDSEADIKHLEQVVRDTVPKADIVVVQFHWGTEYKTQQSPSQENVARRMIDAGANLIIGTHPHAVQGSEFYRGRYITYSLGNFIFDQEWSQGTKEGSVLESYFYGTSNVADNLTPVLISDFHQPKFLTPKEGVSILERIKSASSGF